ACLSRPVQRGTPMARFIRTPSPGFTWLKVRTAALLAASLLLGSCSQDASEPQAGNTTPEPAAAVTADVAGITPAPAYGAAQLNADPVNNWLTTGGSLSNERYSPLDAINRSNVGQLKLNWHTH